MSDEEMVLVSDGWHAARFHRRLAQTEFSACKRLEPQHDVEAIPRNEAEERGLEPCQNCSFPDRAERRVVADGGER
jgi:hypothetical protein